MPGPINDKVQTKRPSQYLDNVEHDDTTNTKGVSIYGTPDGVNVYQLAVGANGELLTGGSTSVTRVDDTTTANVTYIGKAVLTGSAIATSSAVWQVQKVDETTGTVVTWADGNNKYDNIWDNRASLTYN